MTMALSTGQQVTLLRIDDALALTHRYELEVRRLVEPKTVGYQGQKTRLASVRQRGKRKDFYLDLAPDDILLDSWSLPLQTDAEADGVFAGNACYNLVGDPDAIRRCIETQAVIPISEDAKAKIIVSRAPRTTCDDDGLELLYPDIETHHAVVCSLKEGLTPVDTR
jgi:hypothetical protein